MKFVLATHNKGKLSEFKKLLLFPGIDIISMNDIPQLRGLKIEEDGKTFMENAIKKAISVAKKSGYPGIADDSGLVVYALGGRPGIHSARFAGKDASDIENNLKLLKEMKGLDDRRAAFVCVIALAFPAGKTFTYEGRCEGIITKQPVGDKGFGYDPLFYYPPSSKTFAQMSMDEKNRISHRAKAIQRLKEELPKILTCLKERKKDGTNR